MATEIDQLKEWLRKAQFEELIRLRSLVGNLRKGAGLPPINHADYQTKPRKCKRL